LYLLSVAPGGELEALGFNEMGPAPDRGIVFVNDTLLTFVNLAALPPENIDWRRHCPTAEGGRHEGASNRLADADLVTLREKPSVLASETHHRLLRDRSILILDRD
jgi:hypothetical protein